MRFRQYFVGGILFFLAFGAASCERSSMARFAAADRSYSFNYPERWSVENIAHTSDIKLPSGRVAKRIEYTHNKQGVALTEWEVLLPMRDNKILFIIAFTATRLKERYQPTFLSVINSVDISER